MPRPVALRRGCLVLLAFLAVVGAAVAPAHADSWPPVSGEMVRRASFGRLVFELTLINRLAVAVPNVEVAIEPPGSGAHLVGCWSGGGPGAHPCSQDRSDGVARWLLPTLPANGRAVFVAEYTVDGPVERHEAWWRWQGANAGAWSAVFAPRNLVPVRRGPGVNVRKNACLMTADERARFVEAIHALKRMRRPGATLSIYDEFVQTHRDSYPQRAAHAAPTFLPWHRVFVLEFEMELQRVDPRVTIPYWDWTGEETPVECIFTSDFMGGNGDPEDTIVRSGPFREGLWPLIVFPTPSPDGTPVNDIPWLTRSFGTYPGVSRPPTVAELLAALGIPTYDVPPWDNTADETCSFRNHLEGFVQADRHAERLHNAIHDYVGGQRTRGNLSGTLGLRTSPNDPVFWLLHSYIDRVWAEWQRIHAGTYLPVAGARHGWNLNDAMWPWHEWTPASVLDHAGLGYVYATEIDPPMVQQAVMLLPPCTAPRMPAGSAPAH